MKKKMKKAVLTAVLCVGLSSAAIAGGYQLTNRLQTAQAEAQEFTAQLQEEAVEAAVLKQGSKGAEVKEVQRRLKAWGYYNGNADGVFGAGTKAAVVAFQKKNGLTADGVVGASTYKALGMTGSYNVLVGQNASGNTSNTSNTNGFSSSDVYLLAKTIYAEGRGEPYTGQVAIAAVI